MHWPNCKFAVVDNLQLLAEFQDILRTMPPQIDFFHNIDEALPWVGRVNAALHRWDSPLWAVKYSAMTGNLLKRNVLVEPAYRELCAVIHQAIRDLQYKTGAGLNAAIQHGAQFDYFDALRKIIESAKTELFLIDPYLNVDVISRYLPFARITGKVRLLADRYIGELRAAVPLAATQFAFQVELRSNISLHDRFVFVDGVASYQSGASFKDGAKNSNTTLSQLTDTFETVKGYYESLWAASKVELA